MTKGISDDAQFFYFKDFKLYNPDSVFRINTDGVLLAAWCALQGNEKVLDLGTGTGVISFILSYRYAGIEVHSIDDNAAAISCLRKSQNLNTGFDNISSECISFFDFDLDLHRVDHIISNPPFFNDGTLPRSDIHQSAKHNFSFSAFWKKVGSTRNKAGKISMILPYETAESFISQGSAYSYTVERRRQVIKESGIPIRLLFTMSCDTEDRDTLVEDDLLIQNGGNRTYTEEYKALTKDLYLNF